jgi:hypothetical protein
MLLMFAAAMPALTRTSQYDSTYTQATAVCQHKIEELRDNGYGKLTYALLKTSQDLEGRYVVDQTGGVDTPNAAAPYLLHHAFRGSGRTRDQSGRHQGILPCGHSRGRSLFSTIMPPLQSW